MLTMAQIMQELDAIPKEKLEADFAAARQARRARKKLGVSRPPGGPRKPDPDTDSF